MLFLGQGVQFSLSVMVKNLKTETNNYAQTICIFISYVSAITLHKIDHKWKHKWVCFLNKY